MPCALEDLIKQSTCFSCLDIKQHIQHLELAQIMPSPDTGKFLHGISWRWWESRALRATGPSRMRWVLAGSWAQARPTAGREAQLPLLGTLHKEPLLVKPHQLPLLHSCRPSKQKLSGKFSWKVPRGPSLINDFRKIIQRWINIPQESYFWS